MIKLEQEQIDDIAKWFENNRERLAEVDIDSVTLLIAHIKAQDVEIAALTSYCNFCESARLN